MMRGGVLAVVMIETMLAAAQTSWPWGSVSTCPEGQKPKCLSIDTYFAHVSSCHYFIQCDGNRQPICKECPPGLNFNLNGRYCDYPNNVPCYVKNQPTQVPRPVPTTKVPRPVSKPQSSTRPVPTSAPVLSDDCIVVPPEEDCPDLFYNGPDKFLRHPLNPQCYFVCVANTAVVRHCPGILTFNMKDQLCE